MGEGRVFSRLYQEYGEKEEAQTKLRDILEWGAVLRVFDELRFCACHSAF